MCQKYILKSLSPAPATQCWSPLSVQHIRDPFDSWLSALFQWGEGGAGEGASVHVVFKGESWSVFQTFRLSATMVGRMLSSMVFVNSLTSRALK